MGGFRGSKIKSPGNVMNCQETNKKIVDPPHSGGGGFPGELGGGGQNVNKSPGNFMNCRENR